MKRFNSFPRSDLKASLKSALTKKRLIIAGSIIGGFIILTPVITYAYFAHDISNRDRLMNRNNTGIVLKDRHGTVFYRSGTVDTDKDLPLNQISDNVEHALIASEDHAFYTEPGVSIHGIVGAAIGNLMNRDATRYGGSTITQQLVKNKLLSSNKNYLRKYQEISMAIAVDKKYSKNEILDMYLNSVYFGEGAFGISEAAKTYYNKSAAELNLAESSQLVGLLPAPTAYSPISGSRTMAKEQQKRVLTKMVENNYISEDQKDAAASTDLAFSSGSSTSDTQAHAQHFARMVLDQLKKKYGEEKINRSGFEVTTGLDLGWQTKAEQIVRDRVAVTRSAGGRNASLVAEDPTNGEIRALVGSVDFSNTSFGQVNMATALRQPGSSFKPIYYSKAIEKKLVTAATILDDKKTTFGGTYTPSNYDNRYKGKMPLRNALAESRNVPAVEVMQKLGVSNAVDAAHEMGINTVNDPSKYGLSLALGTAEIRLVDMVNAYSAFANKGEQHNQVLITKVQDKFGKTVFKNKTTTKRVRSEASAYVIDSILSDTSARAPTYGSTLNINDGRQFALKTGTTNDNRDAWTIGFTPNLVIGAWTGNNEHEPMIGFSGGSSAGQIWKRAMASFVTQTPKASFTQPKDVVQLSVCHGSGLKATTSGSNTYKEYFVKGSEPTATCNAAPVKTEDNNAKREENPKEKQEPTPTDTEQNNGNGQGNGNGDTDQTAPPAGGTTTPTPTPTPTPTGGGQGSDENPPDPNAGPGPQPQPTSP